MSNTKPKNVLWIMTDQHLASCLGCMGNDFIQTPNLDRLAESGTLFTNAFCQTPACMASRASVFTGRYPTSVKVFGMGILPPQETTLPEWLRRHGYATGAFGKLHLTPEKYTEVQLGSDAPIIDWRQFQKDAALPPYPNDPHKENYGFETHVGCDDKGKGNFIAWLREAAPELVDKKPERFPDGPGDLYVSPYPSEFHHTTFIANAAVDYLKRSERGEKPWFNFCSFVAPHHPFDAPADQIGRYDEANVPLPPKEVSVDVGKTPDALVDCVDQFRRYPEDIQRKIILHYYASISLIDDGVGRLLDALRETGQEDDTIILFTADHGEHLGHHGLIRKPSFHYDETLRVPLIVKRPGQTEHRRVDGLVELVDLYPTLLGLLGIESNPGAQGLDLSDALVNEGPIGREDIYSDIYQLDPMLFDKQSGPYCACRTIRTENWKLNVYPEDDLESCQLFDLKNDPLESRNLFLDPVCRDKREEMLFRLIARIDQNTDPLPLRLTQW